MKTHLSFIAAIVLAFTAGVSTAAEKEQIIRTVSWSDVKLPAGAVVQNKPGASPTLLVKHDGAKALKLPLWKLEKPGIAKKCYALRGKLRCKDVADSG